MTSASYDFLCCGTCFRSSRLHAVLIGVAHVVLSYVALFVCVFTLSVVAVIGPVVGLVFYVLFFVGVAKGNPRLVFPIILYSILLEFGMAASIIIVSIDATVYWDSVVVPLYDGSETDSILDLIRVLLWVDVGLCAAVFVFNLISLFSFIAYWRFLKREAVVRSQPQPVMIGAPMSPPANVMVYPTPAYQPAVGQFGQPGMIIVPAAGYQQPTAPNYYQASTPFAVPSQPVVPASQPVVPASSAYDYASIPAQ